MVILCEAGHQLASPLATQAYLVKVSLHSSTSHLQSPLITTHQRFSIEIASTTIPEDWSSLFPLNQEPQTLLSQLPDPNFQLITPETTIADLRALGPNITPSEKWLDVTERDKMIAMRDGFQSRVRIYSPVQKEKRPLLILIHGGGSCTGSLEQVEKECRIWVKEFGGVVVGIDHRLAPEAGFPVPVEDCWDCLVWVAAHVDVLGVDTGKQFVVGGVSSGSTPALILAHQSLDSNLQPPITGLFLSLPLPCVPSALPPPFYSVPRIASWSQCTTTPIFSTPALSLFSRSYPSPPESPLRSPFLWLGGHAKLPPVFLHIAGADPCQDYGLLFEEVLRVEGVKTKAVVWLGLPHGFWGFFPKAEFSEEYSVRTKEGMRGLLEGLLEEGGFRVVTSFGRKVVWVATNWTPLPSLVDAFALHDGCSLATQTR